MMFVFIFPTFWLSLTAFMTYMFYFVAPEVTVNGVLMSQAEFSALLWPKVLFGVFWLIGIISLISSINFIIHAKPKDYRSGQEHSGMIDDKKTVFVEKEQTTGPAPISFSVKSTKNADIINQIENSNSVWD